MPYLSGLCVAMHGLWAQICTLRLWPCPSTALVLLFITTHPVVSFGFCVFLLGGFSIHVNSYCPVRGMSVVSHNRHSAIAATAVRHAATAVWNAARAQKCMQQSHSPLLQLANKNTSGWSLFWPHWARNCTNLDIIDKRNFSTRTHIHESRLDTITDTNNNHY